MSANWSRNAFVYLLIIVAAAALFINIYQPGETPEQITLSQLANAINDNNVDGIVVREDEVRVTLDNGGTVVTRREPGIPIVETLAAMGVSADNLSAIDIRYESPSNAANWLSLLVNLLPIVFVGALFFFLFRQTQGSNNQALSFGKSRARLFTGDKPTVKFDDVAGAEESKQELQEVVEFLKEPQKFAALGARIPKGVLMVGAPGTGKTLLAKAVAGEAGVPFFSSSGSEFVEMFVGVGASRVRDLFEQAKKNSPCIIFIDEIDAVGRHRGAGLGGGNDEREQTLNQILVEMDGFDTDTNIVIIAATNRPDILDPALLRPGRFDRKVVVDRPDRRGREAILKVHARGKPLAPDVDLAVIAAQTVGMVGADLENLVNEAAILAARRNKRSIAMDEMVESIERVMAGPARRSRVLDQNDRRVVAYHEAGRALVMEEISKTETVGKITIVSRGQSLGYVMPLPEEDKNLRSRTEYEDSITGLLAGRAAEELIFNEPSTRAAADLERVTKVAKAMVTRFGMSDVIGPVQLQQGDANPFMGMDIGEQRSYSEDVARKIDREVRRIVDSAYTRAKEILTRRNEQLVLLAETLLEKEVLERQEFLQLIGKGTAPAAAAAD